MVSSMVRRLRQRIADLVSPRAHADVSANGADGMSDEEFTGLLGAVQAKRRDFKGLREMTCPDCGAPLSLDVQTEESMLYVCVGGADGTCGYKMEVLL